MSKRLVVFAYTARAYASATPAPDPADVLYDHFMRGRLDMYRRLRALGFEVLVTINGQSSFHTAAPHAYAQAYFVDSAGLPKAPVQVPLGDISVIINRTTTTLVVPGVEVMVNDPATYAYGENKLATYRDILEPNGLGIPAQPVTSPADLEAALALFGPGDVALKKINGSLSQGLHLVGQPEARRLVAAGLGVDYLAQPRFDFAVPWSPDILPLQESLRELLIRPGLPKELRTYFFYLAGQGGPPDITRYSVARVETVNPFYMTVEGSRWFGLQPSSVPSEVYAATEAVARTLGERTGARAIYGCLDSGHGQRHGSDEPAAWTVVEGNFCGPGLMGPDRFPVEGRDLHGLYVDFVQKAAISS